MAITRPAAPFRDPLIAVDPVTGQLVTRGETAGKVTGNPWLTWFRDLREDVDASPSTFTPVSETAQTDAIATTAMPTDGDLSAGLYRLSWYGQVVTPGGVSGDFQVTISWTTNGITQSQTGALINGNTTATHEANSVPLMQIDAATPVSYAVAYNSNPANAMVYDLYLTLERLAAL